MRIFEAILRLPAIERGFIKSTWPHLEVYNNDELTPHHSGIDKVLTERFLATLVSLKLLCVC